MRCLFPAWEMGVLTAAFSVSATGSFHFSKGDKTQNPGLYANYCLVKQVIAFDLSWVPYEYFTMSHEIKSKRHVFSHWYYHHEASGNVQLNTTIQLLNKWRKDIHLALRLGYIFPSALAWVWQGIPMLLFIILIFLLGNLFLSH